MSILKKLNNFDNPLDYIIEKKLITFNSFFLMKWVAKNSPLMMWQYKKLKNLNI